MTRLHPIASLRSLLFAAAPLLCSVSLVAQTHKVEAPQRVTRAVAVYEWTGELDKPTAARLVPVSLFIYGKFVDAGIYLARPVPFALQTGDLYAVEKAGDGQGLFAVDHARKVMPPIESNISNGMWYAYGRFTPPKPLAKAAALHASTQISPIVSASDNGKPHFSSKPDSSAKPDTSTKPAADPDRPQLKRPTDSSTQSSKDSTDAKDPKDTKDSNDARDTKSSKDDDVDRPTLRKRDPAEDAQRRKAASSQSGVTGPEGSLNDDPDRPTMRRGAAPGTASTAELTGLPSDLHQVAAVSDPANRDPHVFARDWETPTERAATLAQLEAIARPRIAAYVAANQLTLGPPDMPTPATAATPIAPGSAPTPPPAETDPPKLQRGVPKAYQTPTPAPKTPAPKTSAPATTAAARARAARLAKAKPAPAPLELVNEQLTPYTLSYGGLPTFVYTAQANLKTGGPVYLTLVTQRLVSGDLQVALSSVTDAAHLDRTPWFRLVDAVDPDAGHRASLLFELRSQNSRQFALYRLTSAQAEQIFATGTM